MFNSQNQKPYSHQPMFWSDIGKLGFEAVGQIDSKLQTVGIWDSTATDEKDPKFNRGIVYYLDNKQKLVGVVL